MNTSKQVNVMIGLLFLAFATFSGYILYEGPRADAAAEKQDELIAKRGADLFVGNCRSCHGMEGLGPEEGGVGPALNRTSFLIMEEGNEFGVPATPEGEVRALHDFLFNSIACGRTGTAMPVWSERHGGPLSDTQINYLVSMITMGRWDLVAELGHEHDVETGDTKETVMAASADPSGLALTTRNCGQYNALTAREFHERDPFAVPAGDGEGTPAPGGGGTPEPAGPTVKGLPVGDFFLASCAACHGQKREGLVGPALTPSVLTQPDDFYFDTISNGRPGTAMPAWSAQGLTDDEIHALVTFIKTVEP